MLGLKALSVPPKNEVIDKLLAATVKLRKEQSLIEASAPAFVIGDLHGDCYSLNAALELMSRECAECKSIVLLGDYIDRGPNGMCVIDVITDLYLNSSIQVVPLRGNHETKLLSSSYGFLEEIKHKYPNGWREVFNATLMFFSQLPYATLISQKVLAFHGGLPNGIMDIKDFINLEKGLTDINPYKHPHEYQIVWNDPAEGILGFVPSKRGHGSYLFGPDVTTRFLRRNNLNLIIRGHTPQLKGYAYYHNKKILSIFTCKYYGFKTSVAIILKNGEAKPLPLH